MQKKLLTGVLIFAVSAIAHFAVIAVILPPTKTIKLTWEYPQLDPQIVFKVYQSTNLTIPMEQWIVVTNVTGLSCVLPMNSETCFYTVVASNIVTGMQSAFR